jgi:predicted  nucleic acid-binding Zn ribbon protein
MPNPELVTCIQDEWTKVAEGVMAGFIHVMKKTATYYYTYRMTGDPVPEDRSEAIPISEKSIEIAADAPIDVYLYTCRTSGLVRVDI